MKHPKDWDPWLAKACQTYGFAHRTSPLIYDGTFRKIGGMDDFARHVESRYGVAETTTIEFLQEIAAENLEMKEKELRKPQVEEYIQVRGAHLAELEEKMRLSSEENAALAQVLFLLEQQSQTLDEVKHLIAEEAGVDLQDGGLDLLHERITELEASQELSLHPDDSAIAPFSAEETSIDEAVIAHETETVPVEGNVVESSEQQQEQEQKQQEQQQQQQQQPQSQSEQQEHQQTQEEENQQQQQQVQEEEKTKEEQQEGAVPEEDKIKEESVERQDKADQLENAMIEQPPENVVVDLSKVSPELAERIKQVLSVEQSVGEETQSRLSHDVLSRFNTTAQALSALRSVVERSQQGMTEGSSTDTQREPYEDDQGDQEGPVIDDILQEPLETVQEDPEEEERLAAASSMRSMRSLKSLRRFSEFKRVISIRDLIQSAIEVVNVQSNTTDYVNRHYTTAQYDLKKLEAQYNRISEFKEDAVNVKILLDAHELLADYSHPPM